MTMGLIGVAVAVWLFFGLLMVVPALLLLGIFWIVKRIAGKPKAPSAARRDSAKGRLTRGRAHRGEAHAADSATASGEAEHIGD